MKHGNLILEKKEYIYLKSLLNVSEYSEAHQMQKSLQKFAEELKTATILDEEDMLSDVVRLNSIVTVASDGIWEKTIQIVKPSEKDLKNNKVSLLTPIGIALFGYALNDTVHWEFPGGKKEVKILEVNQEESNKYVNSLI